VSVCHARGIANAARVLARHAPLRLHVGCGTRLLPGWCNVDLGPEADLRVDARRRLPVRDASCIEIYSEHLVEHLAYPGEVEAVLREWHRVLVPGGRLSVGVPDAAPSLLDYAAVRDRFVPDHTQAWCPVWIETALDQMNYLFRQQALAFGQDHLYAYDFPTLAARLASAGFVDARQRPFDRERDSRPGTLYVDAWKPSLAPSSQGVSPAVSR
jgi:predicted SAM-dependent methyltransferase